jgi:outer membrane protein assembly factor BamD
MPAAAKQELMKAYDDRAADAYGRVVTHYSMAPHVEDARERLIALNRQVPEPTQAELAESEAEEQSRIGVTLKQRALFLVKHGPTTVNAARIGEPTLTDSPDVEAPTVTKENVGMFTAALAGKPIPAATAGAPAATEAANAGAANQTPAGDSGTPLQLESVPAAGSSGPGGPAIGASIVSEGDSSNSSNSAPAAGQSTAPPGTYQAPKQSGPADPGAAAAAAAAGVPGAQNQGGLTAVAPTNTTVPAVEKPADAPVQVNDVHGANTAQVQTGTSTGANSKKAKSPKYDSSGESSSKHKPKKGLDKLNPF